MKLEVPERWGLPVYGGFDALEVEAELSVFEFVEIDMEKPVRRFRGDGRDRSELMTRVEQIEVGRSEAQRGSRT